MKEVQETLEEAAKRIVLETFNKTFSDYPKGGKLSNETVIDSLTLFFRLGSEWQQEQNKKLYNEEEVIKLLKGMRVVCTFGSSEEIEDYINNIKK